MRTPPKRIAQQLGLKSGIFPPGTVLSAALRSILKKPESSKPQIPMMNHLTLLPLANSLPTLSLHEDPSSAEDIQESRLTKKNNSKKPASKLQTSEPVSPMVQRALHNAEERASATPVDSASFRRDLNRRMGIQTNDKKATERIKRDRRQWVLEECIRGGMDLRLNFSSYPYETKMYPAIKGITQGAPPEWGWDRMVTKDVIRTLCWDRVRSMNRRIRAANPEAVQTRPGPKRHKQPSSQPATTFRVDPDLEVSQSHRCEKHA